MVVSPFSISELIQQTTILITFLLFFSENMLWHVMQIAFLKPLTLNPTWIFWVKYKKQYQIIVCYPDAKH